MKGGYDVILRNSKEKRLFTSIRLQCSCCRRARPSKATKNTTTSTKVQDMNKPICNMYFNIFEDHEFKQFFIRQNGGHNFHHSGHAPVPKELRRVEKRHVQKHTIGDIENLLKSNVDSSTIQEYAELKIGQKLKEGTIRKLRKSVLMSEFQVDNNTQETTAQTLIRWLKAQPDYHHVAYYGSLEEATQTVRVRKETSKGKRKKRVKTAPVVCAVKQKTEGDGEIGAVSLLVAHDGMTQSIEVDSCGKGGAVTSSPLAEDTDIGKSLWFVL